MNYFLFIIENILNPSNLNKKRYINKEYLYMIMSLEYNELYKLTPTWSGLYTPQVNTLIIPEL